MSFWLDRLVLVSRACPVLRRNLNASRISATVALFFIRPTFDMNPRTGERSETIWTSPSHAKKRIVSKVESSAGRAPRAGLWNPQLSITFGPIMGNAEHLAVLGRPFAALAPCGNVVGVHFVDFIDSALVRVAPNRAERTVGLAVGPRCLRLLSVCGPLDRCVEDPDLQQLCVYRA